MPHLLLLSDTHDRPPDPATLPAVDVLIHAGDATVGGGAAELWRWVEWLRRVGERGIARVVVGGNHDDGLAAPGPLREDILQALAEDGVVWLEASGAEVAGLRVWGAGWSRPASPRHLPGWGWPLTRPEAGAALWAQIPEDLDVLVTHAPPARILDRGGRRAESLGDPELRWRLDQLGARAPRLHVFGHIHEARGALYSGDTLHVNAAYLDRRYQPTAEPLQVVHLGRRDPPPGP